MSGREEYLDEVRDQIRVAKARSSDSVNQVDMPRTNLLSDATARLVRKRFENKRRVYVNDPSEAPDDADVQEGPRGGLYFETGGGESRRPQSTGNTSSDFDIGMDEQVDQLDDQDVRNALGAAVVMHNIVRDTDIENEDPAKMDLIEGLVSSGRIADAYEFAYGRGSVAARDMRNTMRENAGKDSLEFMADRYLRDEIEPIRDSLKETTRQLGVRQATVARDVIRDALESNNQQSPSDNDSLAEEESRRTPREIAVGYPQLRLSSIHEYRDNEDRYESYTKSKKMNTEELRERLRMARKYAPQRKLVSNATAKLVRKRFENKRRVYITDPSEAPDSADVEEGPRGGMYYETGGTSSGQSTFGEGEKPPGYLGGPGNPIPDSIDNIEADLPVDTAVNYGDANPEDWGGQWIEYDDSGEYFRSIETIPATEVLSDDEIDTNPFDLRDHHFITEAYVDMEEIFENPDDLSAGLTEDALKVISGFSGVPDDPLAFAVENPTFVASAFARYYGGDSYNDMGDYDDIMAGFGIDSTTNV